MSDMTEIEKAIDEFERKSRAMEYCHHKTVSDGYFQLCCYELNEARNNLLELIRKEIKA